MSYGGVAAARRRGNQGAGASFLPQQFAMPPAGAAITRAVVWEAWRACRSSWPPSQPWGRLARTRSARARTKVAKHPNVEARIVTAQLGRLHELILCF